MDVHTNVNVPSLRLGCVQPSLAPSSFSSTSHTDVMALSVDDELKFQEKIELSRCVVTPERLVIYPNLYGFVIEMSNRQPDSFFCSSQEDRDMWVKAIREAVSKVHRVLSF